MQHEIVVPTSGPGFYEITGELRAWLGGRGAGLATLFIRHTSASLLVQENADPDVQADLAGFLRRLAPRADAPGMGWITHRAEGADDMPAHLRAAVLPVSLSIPVQGGHPLLGTWQGVYVVEHRDHPQRRRVAVHFAPDR